ncbi:hypothetical protein [Curtobacterium sp. VKM Ac-1393]|uniref:hypothetical protein n=1 Tax=Curtobacterium sp. VKM Ac-1393 TaxID=2783814 RepID=UPI00188D53DF|nr:hypothetical protein [Curtobacterium sp. VKM Ac-1393]MBF4606538.1 hypothetical protein [Curtobacterium sp. VKM Ac-1393]
MNVAAEVLPLGRFGEATGGGEPDFANVGGRDENRSTTELDERGRMEATGLSQLLDEIQGDIAAELATMPSVVKKDPASFDVKKLAIEKREWHQLDDVVAVVVDLKGSSRLGTGKHASSTASIYEASTDNAVGVLKHFGADFIQIQGDGAFGLFWGDNRYEKAVCAGITVKTFSVGLSEKIRKRWPDAPETGYKVGIASGRVLAKRIGTPRNPNEQEPIWSGKPVNYAAKAAQTAGLGELIVSADVWASIEDNDYLTTTCAHEPGTKPVALWRNKTIDNVPEEDDSRYGRVLTSSWCTSCGETFCDAILQGETTRTESEEARDESMRAARAGNLEKVMADKKAAARNRRTGLSNR